MPKVNKTLAQLTGAVMFSKLDANNGFCQIPLAKPSRLLTTIWVILFQQITFSITSAPEVFRQQMSDILHDLPGVLCHIRRCYLVFGSGINMILDFSQSWKQ